MPWAAIALIVAAALVDAWSSAHHGDDFRDFMSGGLRFIAGADLYEGVGLYHAMIGPPFQGLFHVPFAALYAAAPDVALALWTMLNFVALVAAVRIWAGTLSLPASSPAVLAAVLVVAFPLYREFQGQNMTALLLLFAALCARALVRGDDAQAGIWVALGAALKFYPGMPLVYFAARSKWRMAFAGGAAALGFSCLPILRYGGRRFFLQYQEWIATRQSAVWPTDFHSQSLPHVVRLYWPGDAAAQAATAVFVLLVAATALLAWSRRRTVLDAGPEMAFATLIGFVASPIGWVNYWVLAIPALLVVSKDASWHAPSRMALIIAAFLGLVVAPIVRDHPRGEFLAIAVLLLVMLVYRLRPGAASSVAS